MYDIFVLSFSMDEGETIHDDMSENPLGDIVISLDTAEAQASAHDYSLFQEVTFLLIHGFCHLLGHDHGESEIASTGDFDEIRDMVILELVFDRFFVKWEQD